MKKKLKGSIDRFEGQYAVILIGEEGDRFDMPVSMLPEEAKEGDYIELTIKVSANKTKEAKEKSVALIEKLKQRKTG